MSDGMDYSRVFSVFQKTPPKIKCLSSVGWTMYNIWVEASLFSIYNILSGYHIEFTKYWSFGNKIVPF